MKNPLRATALTCAVLALSLGFSPSPAHASNSNTDLIRTAQMRLAGLGYYVGRYDGNMGPVTENAIRDFQRTNGITATGQLSPETYSLLAKKDMAATQLPQPVYYPVAYQPTIAYGQYVLPANAVMWDDRWHYMHTQTLASRYGNLNINEDDRGGLRHYAVTLNGKPVLFANNQPGVLRVSKTFSLDGEDAVIFTAYHGGDACAYKSYLLTIHNDGTTNNPREVGNCTGSYEAHVADNALFISFPGTYVANGWSTYDVWRYENERLARI